MTPVFGFLLLEFRYPRKSFYKYIFKASILLITTLPIFDESNFKQNLINDVSMAKVIIIIMLVKTANVKFATLVIAFA